MTEAGATQRRLFRSGPWLIVFGAGLASEDVAYRAARHCQQLDIEVTLSAIDEISEKRLYYYTGVVAVLPDAPSSDQKVLPLLQPYMDLVSGYRRWRSNGLQELVVGTKKWFEVGVVHLIGSNAVLRLPALRSVRAESCGVHRLEDCTHTFNFTDLRSQEYLRSIASRSGGEPSSVSLALQGVDACKLRITRWGIHPSEAPKVLQSIRESWMRYEDPLRYPAMYRPVPGYDKNRLAFILEGPDDIPLEDPKVWQENGARAWRSTRDRILSVAPNFRRPNGGEFHKGATRELRQLYKDLRIVTLCDSPDGRYSWVED